jgi:hypothetical protein
LLAFCIRLSILHFVNFEKTESLPIQDEPEEGIYF